MNKRLRMRYHLLLALFGLLIGFSLHRMGFSDYGEMHKLFTFQDFRLLISVSGAVAIAALGFRLVARGEKIVHKPLHKGTAPGGILFGVGWALTGACPNVVLIHVGEGKLIAMATVMGIICGVWLFRFLKPRFFRWTTGSCNF